MYYPHAILYAAYCFLFLFGIGYVSGMPPIDDCVMSFCDTGGAIVVGIALFANAASMQIRWGKSYEAHSLIMYWVDVPDEMAIHCIYGLAIAACFLILTLFFGVGLWFAAIAVLFFAIMLVTRRLLIDGAS